MEYPSIGTKTCYRTIIKLHTYCLIYFQSANKIDIQNIFSIYFENTISFLILLYEYLKSLFIILYLNNSTIIVNNAK